MPQRPITHLRSLCLGVPDLAAERAFYVDDWGLEPAGDDGDDGDVAYLAAASSPEPYVVRLRRSDAKRIDLVAFAAADRAGVDALAENLAADGVQLVSEPGPLQTPGGGYGFRFFDNEGRTLEVSADVEERPTRVLAEREAVPERLSHVVLNSPTPEATVAWWQRHLGFSVSDQLTTPHMGDLMWFLRCNGFHHSIAIARCPHASLHHASFEFRGIDEHLRATGRVKRAGHELVWGPGRHLAGDNTFSYFLDPAGNTVEITTALQVVDDDAWEPHVYSIAEPNVADQWGTAEAMNADVAAKSFNTPDAGLFAAPPV